MAFFRLTRKAEADLLSIGQYTLGKWGGEQAAIYLNGLEACCQKLADNPEIGRVYNDIRPGLRRMEHGRHCIFYRQDGTGITVSRILHQRMLPGNHEI